VALLHAHGREPFFQRDFAGDRQLQVSSSSRLPVMVHNLDIRRRTVAPFKAKAPLVVDADASLAR
jgi:hypothetical protein